MKTQVITVIVHLIVNITYQVFLMIFNRGRQEINALRPKFKPKILRGPQI